MVCGCLCFLYKLDGVLYMIVCKILGYWIFVLVVIVFLVILVYFKGGDIYLLFWFCVCVVIVSGFVFLVLYFFVIGVWGVVVWYIFS